MLVRAEIPLVYALRYG